MMHQRRSMGTAIRWRVSLRSLAPCALVVLVLAASLGEAIVKQPRSDDSQQASSYQNHQANLGSSSSSSGSVPSSSSSSSSPASQSSVSNAQASSQNVYSSPMSSQSQTGSGGQQPHQYSSGSSYGGASPKSSYADQLAASPDQSYQAAAQSVNMALANSGIFGSSQQQPGYANQQPAINSGPSNGQQVGPQQGNQPQASLNPLHYFYYPSKDNQKLDLGGTGGSSYQPQSGSSSSSNNNNNQMNSYASYADQLSSALAQMGSPDAAASSQDPSYLPQPSNNQGPVDLAAQPMVGAGSANLNGPNNQQPLFNGDLATSYGPGQQQPNGGSISFGSSSSNMNQPQPQNQQDGGSSYLNSHHLAHQAGVQSQQGQQSQQPQQLSNQNSGYSPSSYSSLSDLTNSAYGGQNSYLSAGSQHQPGLGAASQHDIFSSLNSAFNSGAASQLSPAQVSPPQQQQSQSSPSSSALNAATNQNSLFGSQANLFSGQSQPSNMFANQPYLSSFLTPQQYSQLTGASASGLGLDQSMSSSSPGAVSAISPAASTSAAATGSSSKRFGISSFIMPMLALAGLSLLIPTMSNIGTAVGKRKKRSISSARQQEISYEPMNGSSQALKEASIGEYMDKIERYYSIYKSAVESDDCLNRLICEFGDAVKDMTGKSAVVTVIEKLVPNWMTGKVHLFKEAALDNKEGKEKCKKYVCQSNKRQH